jgi:large subunit ribosomal protein L34e
MKLESYVIYKSFGFIASFLNKTRFPVNIMVAGRHKSKTFRKVFVRTPGAKTVVHYRKRKPQKAHCAACSKVLPGVASKRPYKMKNLPKTKKRPERPYAGMLCSRCMRAKIKGAIKK